MRSLPLSLLQRTEEQERVFDAIIGGDTQGVLIRAGAGTGKTSLVQDIALTLGRNNKKLLYLSFNRHNAQDIESRLGRHATSKTLNAFAFAQSNLKRRNPRQLKVSEVCKALGLSGEAGQKRSREVIQTLTSFCQSDAHRPNASHLPGFSRGETDTVLHLVGQLYGQIRPGRETHLPCPHDVYFKAWQLAGCPGLDAYDLVVLDEYQDGNAANLAALKKSRRWVAMGDPMQSIYGFRGANTNCTNVLNGEDVFELSLSCSFRFGSEVASIANGLTQATRHGGVMLEGLDGLESRVGRMPSGLRHTRLYRSQSDLVFDAYFLATRDFPIRILGEQKELANMLEAGWEVHEGRKSRHGMLRRHPNWESVLHASESDVELAQMVTMIQDHQESTPRVIEMLRADAPSSARVDMVTVHQSKGREFSDLVVFHDFDRAMSEASSASKRDLELRLAYVAVTRAMRTLDVRSKEIMALSQAQEVRRAQTYRG